MNYIIRDYSIEDEESVLNLMQIGMGGGPTGTREQSFWRWKHYKNPFGNSIAIIAVTGDRQIIGLRTFMRWNFLIEGEEIRAVRAVDTVTHPEFRRYGVFSRLTNIALERVKQEGIDLIFNTPNQSVLPGYLKLGWHYISLVQPLIKILNYPKFCSSYIFHRKTGHSSGQLAATDVLKNDLPTMDEFLKDTKGIETLITSNNSIKGARIFTQQSPKYFAWRYAGHDFGNYRVFSFKKDNSLVGCAIIRPSTRFSLKEVVLDELLISCTDEKMVSSFLTEFKKNIKADYIITYFPSESFHRQILKKQGFFQVPRQGQNFTVNNLCSDLPTNPLDFQRWGLSMGDLEVF